MTRRQSLNGEEAGLPAQERKREHKEKLDREVGAIEGNMYTGKS